MTIKKVETDKLLALLAASKTPSAEEFRQLVLAIDSHNVLAKVFLLEGTPFVFKQSPMKYVIFREQVGERFEVGSQDVCIVGSAKLGFSPSATKYGTSFDEMSDVDVVIISEPLFHRGSAELFRSLNELEPAAYLVRSALRGNHSKEDKPCVDLQDWLDVKEAIRNYVYNNFNPGLLPDDNLLRREVFEKISSTAGLFLALEPQVFVSRIRCRIFRTWKSAEDYYANSLRQLQGALRGAVVSDIESDDEDAETIKGCEVSAEPLKAVLVTTDK